jgi:mannose-1-phosphate guanylyltransferase
VGNVSAFLEICQKAIEQAHHTNGLITLGIEPTHPATGYGYIERAEDCQNNVYKVNQFVEKPPLEKAKVYISNQRFSWNGGIFFWHVNTILNEFALHAPVLLNPLSNAYKTGKIANVFSSLPKISIDYAVLEKTTNAYVIPSSFDWDDLGDWQALERLLQKEHTDLNTVIGQHVGLETTGNIIYNENADDMIVTLGIENLVIIKRQNAMLLVHKDKIQDIKHLLKDERLSHFVLR